MHKNYDLPSLLIATPPEKRLLHELQLYHMELSMQNQILLDSKNQAKDALERTEAEKQRMLNILEESADFIGCADLQGNLLYYNQAARRMLGFTNTTDLSPIQVADIYPAWAIREFQQKTLPIVLEKGLYRADSALLHRDGSEIPVSQLVVLHRDSQGQPEFISTIMQDNTARKRLENTLKFIAQRGWTRDGESFLSALASFLVRTLSVDYLLINKLTENGNSFETIAGYGKGEELGRLQYSLKNSPCENFLKCCGLCCHPRQVRQFFPDDKLLELWQAESYAGLPLWDADGKAIGLIAVIDSKPMLDTTEVISLLQIVATSVAAEVSRLLSEKKLTESWNFLSNVIDTLADPVYVKDRQHRWIFLNQAFCELIGLPSAAMLGKTVHDFFPPEEAEIFLANDERAFQNGLELVNEEYFTDRNGVTHTIVSKKTCYTDEDGERVLVGVIRDITEHKRMSALLAAQTQELLTLIEHAPDNIVRYDKDTRISYLNPQHLKSLNQPLEQILGTRADDKLEQQHPAMRGFLAALHRVIATGQPEEYLLEIEEGYFGRPIFDNIRLAPEFDSNGEVLSVIAIGRDYSRQRQLELELASREREFRTLAENSPDIIVRYDKNCRGIYANRACMLTLCATAADILGKTPEEFWRASVPDGHEFIEILQRIIQTGTQEDMIIERTNQQGKRSCFSTYLVPEFDHSQQVCSILCISRDITALKASEQSLQESRAQLRALTAQREETREDERKHIARELHDELGQRLTALRMDISRLRLRFGNENPALLEHIKEVVTALDATIYEVRNVASSLRPAILDMGIVSALEWLNRDFNKRSGITCELLIPQRDIKMNNSQSTALFRIVQESLTNVVRHAHANKVRIILDKAEDGYLLEIRDNGKGLASDAKKKKGSFGLIGIEERVFMLGGELLINSEPGKGFKICIRIPDSTL